MCGETSRHDKRKNELLLTARNVFYRKGYERTSIQDILNEAGIAKGTFYHYFESKENLLDTMVEQFNQSTFMRVQEIVNLDLTPVEKFEKIFRSIRDIKVENVELMISLMGFMYKDSNLLLKKKMDDSFFDFLSPILTRIISQGVDEGTFESPDPEVTSEIILSVFIKYGEKIGPLWNRVIEKPEIISVIEHKMRLLIHAVEKLLGIPEETIHIINSEVFDYFKHKTIIKE